MRIDIKIDGDIKAMMAEEIRAGERAVSGAMRNTGTAVKMAWRQQVLAAGLGTRTANAARSETYPDGRNSLNAAALVWSKAPKIYGAFEKGAIIRAHRGMWLAIPLPAAGKGKSGASMSPAAWTKKHGMELRLVTRPGKAGLLVADGRLSKHGRAAVSRSKTGRGRATVPVFILVRQATLRKTLNLFAAANQAAQMLPAAIVSRWRTTR